MRIQILGSGLLGVSSAYYLSQLGHVVTKVFAQGVRELGRERYIPVRHIEIFAELSAQFVLGRDRYHARTGLREF